MAENVVIRNYRPEDLAAMVRLNNEADAVDGLERATTIEEMEHEYTWPNFYPETDSFLAFERGDGDGVGRLLGYVDFFFRSQEGAEDKVFYTWGMVHPDHRRRGVGRRLMQALYRRAEERLAEVEGGNAYMQASTRDVEEDRQALFESLGMERVRYFVNMARRIDDGLPRVDVPGGFRLRTFDPARDTETVWRVDNEAFKDHWGYTGFPFEEYTHWIEQPTFRPELWLVAEEEATGQAAGICLNKIDPEWIASTGRQEGYVNTLAVLRDYRKMGLGTALLAQSLHMLRDAGMEWAHLGADANNLTGAVRIYERLGFCVRKTSMAYRKTMRNGA
ncbi:MAG: GNAT family N-acetyltransferase [Anaerolineae bacterium]|nr:GNAT family N-acetyltransferase [Anaerolineae bacterium]